MPRSPRRSDDGSIVTDVTQRRPAATRTVALARALSKLGLLSRTEAIAAILDARVRVDGQLVCDPGHRVIPERIRVSIDGQEAVRPAWRTIAFHKPRGVVTTRRDPEGRSTVYDVLSKATGTPAITEWLAPAGRLDAATSGLLLLTNDTRLAAWLTDPAHAVIRVYHVTVRGRVTGAEAQQMRRGLVDRGERLSASAVTIRKASGRETHLVIELTEGKNREIRRLCAAIGHEVTALSRVAFGGLLLGDLAAGEWRDVSEADVRRAFPDALRAAGASSSAALRRRRSGR
jgi:23S rRNA pseudouridine2605 synthase